MTVHCDLPRPRAILFDWDNTLVDSWDTIHESLNTTLLAMGQVAWTPEETRERVRKSLRDAFPAMFGDRWEEARDIFYNRFREIHLEMLKVLPGAQPLVEGLSQAGLYLGVVSNKSGEHLRREASHLKWDAFFGRLVGATDATEDKPAVAPVEMALAGSGIERGPHVWFIGDTWIDMECAYNANCTPILVGEASPLGPELLKWRPGGHYRSCDELHRLVRGIL